MAQYIDKDALVAEIEKNLRFIPEHVTAFDEGEEHAYHKILSFLDTLEVKEVDLEKERIKECPFKKVGCEMYEGHILECKGECSWVVDHLKLKELKAQKGK